MAGPGKKFAPGWAGGPGRPSLKDEFRSRCRQATIDKCLPLWLSEVETNGKDAIRASQLLAEYGFGKPHQQVALTGEDGGPIVVKRAEDLTDDELAAIVAREASRDEPGKG